MCHNCIEVIAFTPSHGAKPRPSTRRKTFLLLISAFMILSGQRHILQVVFSLVREIEALV
jgi:hypothetical protein